MCTMMLNNELNGVELYFESKPLQNIIDSLKEFKFRWNGKKLCWYAKQNDITLKLAHELTIGEADIISNTELQTTKTKTNKADNEKQKQLKEVFKQILISDVWGKDGRMVDHCLKSAEYIVELENGDIIALDKPRIEKDFCFGYSDSSCNTESFDKANDAAYNAKSEGYFLQENMKIVNSPIQKLESLDTLTNVYTSINYTEQPKNSKLKCYRIIKQYDFRNMNETEKEKYTLLSAEDVQKIIDGYKIIKESFEKRLQTYLIKYGTSKINTWSYWQDR